MKDYGKGFAGFNAYFGRVYEERWPALLAALQAPVRKETLKNVFSATLKDYELDPASLFPVKALGAKPGERIFDMCAAPGGKAIASIFALRGDGQWLLNDLSAARIKRLHRVLREHVPEEIINKNILVTHYDASRSGLYQKSEFDRVLLDAPCSGERHLLASPKNLEQWSLKRSKGLARRQYALLCSALLCLKPGGTLVYSTCSISPIENDQVIKRLLDKKADQAQLKTPSEPPPKGVQKTDFGHQILPDNFPEKGPMYWTILEKNRNTPSPHSWTCAP